MFLSAGSSESAFGFIAVALFPVSVVVLISLLQRIQDRKVKARPIKASAGKVVEDEFFVYARGGKIFLPRIVFETADGRRLVVEVKSNKQFLKGEEGVLSYQEYKGKTFFVDFVRS